MTINKKFHDVEVINEAIKNHTLVQYYFYYYFSSDGLQSKLTNEIFWTMYLASSVWAANIFRAHLWISVSCQNCWKGQLGILFMVAVCVGIKPDFQKSNLNWMKRIFLRMIPSVKFLREISSLLKVNNGNPI